MYIEMVDYEAVPDVESKHAQLSFAVVNQINSMYSIKNGISLSYYFLFAFKFEHLLA